MKIIAHLVIVSALTLLTQVGGLIWILVFGTYRLMGGANSKLNRLSVFFMVYLAFALLVIPQVAKIGGRTALPISKSGNLIPHTYLTPLLNRHYVMPALKSDLHSIADETNQNNPLLKVSYLDANFPFIDGFPLLPHLSHNDGRKVDLSFYYTKDQKATNLKPARSGYGAYVESTSSELNQTATCKDKGYWQYDFTKYLTLGGRDDLAFDPENTRRLINLIVSKPKTQKLLIEPHLKNKMGLTHSKIRFQGCHAVRHDDHIHYQIN